ncbi:anaphase promoting complex subunit cdc16 [Phlyctochytrium planicorne]|nr:anaphase promoting complex subunit cdc16 [Phlyctochytrium planicorne]
MAVDWIVRNVRWQNENPWTFEKRLEGYACDEVITKDHKFFQGSIAGDDSVDEQTQKYVLFFKPKGYMNFSGRPVLKACREYHIPISNVLVIHDDLERKLGLISPKTGGSTSGHNGLKSISLSLGSSDFSRIRIGVGRPTSRDPSVVGDYVLSKFSQIEVETLRQTVYPQRPLTRSFGLQGNGNLASAARNRSSSALGERSVPNTTVRTGLQTSEHGGDARKAQKQQTQNVKRTLRRSQTESSATSCDTLIEGVESGTGSGSIQSRLRCWLRDAIDQNMLHSACFWGEKLHWFSDDTEDVYWLAYAYFLTKQYTRCIALLSSRCEAHLPSRCLTAECLMRLDRHGEAKHLLDKADNPVDLRPNSSKTYPSSESLSKASKLHYLKGICALNSKDVNSAQKHFVDALTTDVRCFEAFHQLITGNLLPYEDGWTLMHLHHMLMKLLEFNLISGLEIDSQLGGDIAELVKLSYFIKIKKYMKEEDLRSALTQLETKYNLGNSPSVMLSQAEYEYTQCRFEKSLKFTLRILELDPLNLDCLWTHIACLHQLSRRNDIFLLAHELVDKHPAHPASWFAVGCYYLLCDAPQKVGNSRNVDAKRHFSKATKLDMFCAPAWVGIGHALSADGEHELAISAYAKASKYFRGLHLPFLFAAMEHIQMKNLNAAEDYLKSALAICSFDPLVESELGTIAYHKGQFAIAEVHFRKAIKLTAEECRDLKLSEALWINLGQTTRKMGCSKIKDARECFKKVLTINPGNSGAIVTLGLMHQNEGELDAAIECYHKALSLNPEHPFATSLLEMALEESFQSSPRILKDLVQNSARSNQSIVSEASGQLLPRKDNLSESVSLSRIPMDEEEDDDDEIGRPIIPSRTGILFKTPQRDKEQRGSEENRLGQSSGGSYDIHTDDEDMDID